MTVEQYRKMALSFPGAEEKSHFNHPDFRVGGRIFATLGYPNKESGCVMLTPEEQRDLLASHPQTFSRANGAWGRSGSTIVRLADADMEAVGEALTCAWKRLGANSAAKKTAPAASIARKPAKKKLAAKKVSRAQVSAKKRSR
jgi:hypothetical protein